MEWAASAGAGPAEGVVAALAAALAPELALAAPLEGGGVGVPAAGGGVEPVDDVVWGSWGLAVEGAAPGGSGSAAGPSRGGCARGGSGPGWSPVASACRAAGSPGTARPRPGSRPEPRPGCTPARSAPFYGRVRIVDLDLAVLASPP